MPNAPSSFRLKADFSFMATPGRKRPLASTSCCEFGEPERFGEPWPGGGLDASCGLDAIQISLTRRAVQTLALTVFCMPVTVVIVMRTAVLPQVPRCCGLKDRSNS